MAQLMQHSVYWIHHHEHTDMFTQGYIGVSNDTDRRWYEHHKKTRNAHLKNAINKYGWDNLIKTHVLIGSKDYCLHIETKLRNTENIGWNIVGGGGCPPTSKKGHTKKTPAWNKGLKYSDERRESISKNVIELWENPEYRQRMSDAHKGQPSPMEGKKHSAKTLLQMSLVKLGKPNGRKGCKHSPEAIQRMKEVAVKESWECPHCNTQGKGKGAGNRWHFNNCKQKDKKC
jgi:group I intron endonuclease